MKASSLLFEKTESNHQIRDVITFDRTHDEFLQALLEEIQQRTSYRINKSSIVRTLVESIMNTGMEPGDITNVYRRQRGANSLDDAQRQISQEIADIEADLRLALIDHPSETVAVRQLRRNLRYQRERLRAVEMQMKMEEEETKTL